MCSQNSGHVDFLDRVTDVASLVGLSLGMLNTLSLPLQSYCPKHTVMRKSPTKHSYMGGSSSTSPHKNHMSRPSQLVLLQESFYNYASADDLTTKLHLPHKLSMLIYNYWKLKRKVGWLGCLG